MHLKSLEIQGFKSFASKAIYEFDKGVTAIVGPNGSGKSNIADAIRWVLGEQSYTNLRAQRTADMIFSGSDSRARMGMAHVSIVLDNSDGSLPLDYNEVTIGRRAYRSGENEYLINNNRVRLKDIAELLARGGLARQTYTLVGQGTIDRTLSLRAGERRQLFEEAAGITYHRQQRGETLRRLDDTRQNILRVNDIIKEIEPGLKRLNRQVARVEESHTIRRHLDGLLKIWYGYQWKQGQQSLHHARIRDSIGRERLQEDRTTLNQTQASITELRSQQTQKRGQLGDWHAASSRLHTDAEALQRALAVGEERARHLAAQREEFLSDITALEERLEQQQQQTAETQHTLNELEAAYHTAQEAYQAAEKRLAQHKSQRESLLQQQQHAAEKARRAAQNQRDHQTQLVQLAERLQNLQTQQAAHIEATQTLQQQKDSLAEQLATGRAQLSTLEDELAALQTTQQTKSTDLERVQQAAKTMEKELAAAEKNLTSLHTRQDLLARLRDEMSGYHSGVKAVLHAPSLKGVHGTLAQLIQVPAHLETAIEAAGGGRLQEIVVDRWSHADAAVQYLKQTSRGRATFLPLDSLRPPTPVQVPRTPGIIGRATELVSFSAEIKPAVASIFNRLLVAETLEAARAAFNALQGGFQITTLGGEIVRSGGSVTGGQRNNKQGGGILTREREWRELPAQIAKVEAEIAQITANLEGNVAQQTALQNELNALTEQAQGITGSMGQLREQISTLIAQLTGTENQIAERQSAQVKIGQMLTENESQRANYESRITQFAQEQAEADQEATRLSNELAGLSAETLQAEYSQAQSQINLLQEKRRNQKTLLNNFTNNVNQTQSQLAQRKARANTLTEQRASLLDQLSTQQLEHQTLVEKVTGYTDKIAPVEAELKALEAEQIRLEESENEQIHHLRRLEAEASRLALELARQQDHMDQLHRQIEDDFGLVQLQLSEDQVGQPVLPIESLVTELPVVETIPDGIEEDIRRLKTQLRRLGDVNPNAPEEYAELKDRYDFLTNQLTDLESAATDLKAVIEELDTIMEEAFLKTFEQVNKAFQEYFTILFNGGEAQLILTDSENITETGIDIVARPPGKRLQSLELLSGGERSLTAQALIFSLLKTSPTPYVIFDEVDAMLDEANVDRFRKALVALSQDIQFIVITHNRKTIEVADTIYGIFMRENAVSEAISLKLDDLTNGQAGQGQGDKLNLHLK